MREGGGKGGEKKGEGEKCILNILKSWGVAKKAKQGCEILARKDKHKEKEKG